MAWDEAASKNIVVVTGASQNHYDVLKEWIAVHRPLLEDSGVKVVIYDLGLNEAKRNQLEHMTVGWVAWKHFDYTLYPSHVTMAATCWAWKPIIMALEAFGHASIL